MDRRRCELIINTAILDPQDKTTTHQDSLQYFTRSIKFLSRMVQKRIHPPVYGHLQAHHWSEGERVYLSSIYHLSHRSPNNVAKYADSRMAELMNDWIGEADFYTRSKVRFEMVKPEFQRLLNQRVELAKVSPPRPPRRPTKRQAQQPVSAKCHRCSVQGLICDNASPKCSACFKGKSSCNPCNSGTLAARELRKAQAKEYALKRKSPRPPLKQGHPQSSSYSGSENSQGLILPVSPGSGPFPLLSSDPDPNAWYPPSASPPLPDPRVEEYYRNRHSHPDNNAWRPPTGSRAHLPMSEIDKDFWYSPNNGPPPPPRDPNVWYPPETHFWKGGTSVCQVLRGINSFQSRLYNCFHYRKLFSFGES